METDPFPIKETDMTKQEPELNLELHGAARASMLCDYFKYFFPGRRSP